ncbi:MarR family transcriptional regulator [Streptomyces sp. NPDC048636]|uniref:MarR family winged helix-turn-helix transcriptional regulator n=1 Tax=Streptomyces sp. NPDC048636 TaxID=3155762 RepID=UPI003417BF69
MPTSSPVPESDVEAMVDALLIASRLLVAVSARSLAAVEETLTLPQFRMLVALENRGPLSLSRLAEELGVQPSTAMRMIDRLAAAGVVARGASDVDRRASVISLTDAGRRTVEEVTERRKGELTGIVEAMPPGQRRGLIEALRAFTEAGGEPSGQPSEGPGERGGRRGVAGW